MNFVCSSGPPRLLAVPYGTAQRLPGSGKRKTAKTIQNHEKNYLHVAWGNTYYFNVNSFNTHIFIAFYFNEMNKSLLIIVIFIPFLRLKWVELFLQFGCGCLWAVPYGRTCLLIYVIYIRKNTSTFTFKLRYWCSSTIWESLKTGGPWERQNCKRNSIFMWF